jgi:hypothetical protein
VRILYRRCLHESDVLPYFPFYAAMSDSVEVIVYFDSRGPGFDSRAQQKKLVGLERGPLSLVSTTEELLDRKVAATV